MPDPRSLRRQSKFLSLVLRHRPEKIGLELDAAGWADVETLLAQLRAHGTPLSREELETIVVTNNKQRFAFSQDGRRIRANQGHSLAVDLGLMPLPPPEFLYHGTAVRFLDSILAQGLLKKGRHHVHLSPDRETAVKVGQRHGRVVVLHVRAGEMAEAGHLFYRSDNGVWLTDHVPPRYLQPE